MTFGVCLLFLVPWLMPANTKLCEEGAILLNESDKRTKQSTDYKKTSTALYSFPIEAAFFARTARCDHLLQRSVSMGTLRQNATPPLIKSAMFRAWSAAAQLHCTDSLNSSSGYESDYNRHSSSSQSSEVIDKSIEHKLASVTIVTPAMSFDDMEVIVQQEKLVKEGWVGSSMDMFSVMFENLLEREATNPRTSIVDSPSNESDSQADGETGITTRLSQAELGYNLDLCRETIL